MNGSFYQNGLAYGTADTGLGGVPANPTPTLSPSSFYRSGGSSYDTLMNSDALLASITAQQVLATTAASSSMASQIAAAASAASAAATLAGAALKANNLSDLASIPAAKINLALVKGDVGLGSVDNTSDVNKPVSTAQAAADALKADIASPTLTGVPAAPTAAVNTNTTQLATTQFVLAQAGSLSPVMDGAVAVGTATKFSREDHVHPTDTSRAPLASPGLTGIPTAPTAAGGTNTTQLATTAFVAAAVTGAGVASIDAVGGAFTTGSGIKSTSSQLQIDGAFNFRNRIINGRFRVDQRNSGASISPADNAYWSDRWRHLTETTSHLCTAADTTMGGGRKNGKMAFQGGTEKGGYWQVIEGINCKDMRSKAVTLSVALQVSNVRLGNIKIGIIEFTGTEDAVSGDPISAWGADGVTPTLAASYAFVNTPANLSVTTSGVTYSTTVTLGSTFNNLAVFIWNDDKTYTANDALYVTDVQLEQAASKTNYAEVSIDTEYSNCTYYFRKRIAAVATESFAVLHAYATTVAWGSLENWRSPMRVAPTASLSALADFRVWNADTSVSASPSAVTFTTSRFGSGFNAVSVGSVLFGFAGQATQFSGTVAGTASISYNSEL